MGNSPEWLPIIEELRAALARQEAALATANRKLIELQLVVRGASVPPPERWDRANEAIPGDPHDHPPLTSAVCRQRDFDTPWFRAWISRFGIEMRYHRAVWESVYVAEALRERGMLAAGRRGIGFGVGRELLPAAFAASGCEILATDLPVADATEKGWAAGTQYAGALDGLRHPATCPDDVFDRLVRFRTLDMNALPDDLGVFDFCWSCCAFEHLGTLDAGMTFVGRSLALLRRGGVAVHTTELNTSSDSDTVAEGRTVLYRARDLRSLRNRLTANGHEVAPLDLGRGNDTLDRFVDLPPYEHWEPHLTLIFRGYSTTSTALIIRKAAA